MYTADIVKLSITQGGFCLLSLFWNIIALNFELCDNFPYVKNWWFFKTTKLSTFKLNFICLPFLFHFWCFPVLLYRVHRRLEIEQKPSCVRRVNISTLLYFLSRGKTHKVLFPPLVPFVTSPGHSFVGHIHFNLLNISIDLRKKNFRWTAYFYLRHLNSLSNSKKIWKIVNQQLQKWSKSI